MSDPVAEHSTVGTVVGTLAGVDQDGDDVAYSLSGTHAALFSISSADIVIADAAGFGHEAALGDSVDVTATATSTVGSGAAMMDAINRWLKVKIRYYFDKNQEDRDSVLSEEFITIK